MNLSQRLAESMASGAVAKLPRLTRHASPDLACCLLAAYYRLRDTMEALRVEGGDEWTLTERVAASTVVAEIDAAIRDTRAWLSVVARKGGRAISVDVAAVLSGRP